MAPKIWEVLCESKRIIYIQPRLYMTLSLIFLLPLSLFSLVFQLILEHLQQQQPPTSPTIIIFLSTFSLLISSIFTNCAFISITYSVYHSYFNQPIKLKEAIKSIYTSFFPLLATDIIVFTIFFIGLFLIAFVVIVISSLLAILGGVDLQAHSFLVLASIMLVVLPPVMYLTINLSLVKNIVVVESVWGFEPLRRSWRLVKGMKMLIFSIFCLFGSLEWMLTWITGHSWVLKLVTSPILIMLSLYNIAVITVVYIYCKEKYGELADEEFGKEKDGASLPLIA
ncbi:uncharacterized protein LOC131607318 [Vicia villosa]|uniref:uncharacterized protein LOC131607318 n=1 Tax=Vicia villosa TaxID=3911 RepID=UPI00273C67D5|nr:uncharacterized protein LOC131607318 [Vicia villosa]